MPDLVVVGGGPVGLSAALYAVRSGLSVTVLEPRTGPVDKACGEGLMPGAVTALAALGVEPPGWELQGIRYTSGSRSAVADFPAGPGRGVRRTTLHQALLDAVHASGVEVVAAAVTGLAQDPDGVQVTTSEPSGLAGPTLRGSYVLAADGLHSPVRRRLGLDRQAAASRRFGLRRHFATTPWSRHVEVHWGATGEAYVTPVGEDLVGVAVLSAARVSYDEHLAGFPALQERLREASPATPVRGAGPLRQRAARRTAGRVLLVGDASGYVDALTGEGISLGLAQARAAVDAVARDRPHAYEAAWRSATWRYAALTHALLLATRPAWGRRAVVPAASAAPFVFRAAVAELGRTR
ncbi:Dehydrogenase (flavoprotein) [Pedococcus cremeus]|uniref:Dehydrogenase (Flavoprotein) n=1 Tax=Pedococcus cremeus TaxID=587636 RepID=A0A1H9TNX3_9MICO|nr:NAD(P)/FAD-dependent oxidoreductase [Pedococcus cremeus]SER98811.1 Dehydrogenase (flavoprotein) [Pedococcus cremeus]